MEHQQQEPVEVVVVFKVLEQMDLVEPVEVEMLLILTLHLQQQLTQVEVAVEYIMLVVM